jgi:heme-degrading monooxygenase HmoA
MKPKRSIHKSKQKDLFRTELTKIIDHRHGLVKLAQAVDWNRMDARFIERYCPGSGRPAISTRLMVSLQYLKHVYTLSDHDVVYGWVENPYWQYLSGMQYFEHDPPINPSSMSRWRKRIGEAGAEALLEETIAAGLTIKTVKPHPFKQVTVDTIPRGKEPRGGSKTIVRLWHGRTPVSQADAYAEFLKESAVPDYSAVDGLTKLYFLRRSDEDVAHFLLVTLWDSMDAVVKFAGEHPDKAKYYPEEDSLLLEKELSCGLYELFFEK